MYGHYVLVSCCYVTPGLAFVLKFPELQSTIVIAVVNSGSVLVIIGGITDERYRYRITASIAALGASFSDFSMGFICVLYESTQSYIAYILVLFLVLLVNTSSYCLYS